MARVTDIRLPAGLRDRLSAGHPWVYRTHVPAEIDLPPGARVRVRSGNFQAYGIWDAAGPIAVRLFATRSAPDDALIVAQVRAAWELRAPLRATGITAYRWLFGEGDGLPGIVVDRYDDFAVLATYSAGVATLTDAVVRALHACDPALRGVVVRRRDAEDEERATGVRGHTVLGEAPPADLVVVEHGLRFYADLFNGQKTGLFLDQRENRRAAEQWSSGRTILNCFSYTGAFSLYALRGGARHVTSADIGKGLAEATEANLVLNDIDLARHRFVTEDCFALLERYAAEGRRFDMVIVDPPSFARNREQRPAALHAYTRLNNAALRCVVPGGLIVSASCTSQVGPEAFREVVAEAAASADRRVQLLYDAGHALDHPVPPQFPEGRYLKCLIGRVSERV